MNETMTSKEQQPSKLQGAVPVGSGAVLGAGVSLDPINTDAAKILSNGKPTVPHIETLDEAMRIICDKILCGYSVPLIINNLKAGATTTYSIIIKPTKNGTTQVELECEVSPMKRCILNLSKLQKGDDTSA